MPIYEYKCVCGAKQEHIERFDAKPKRDCPTCGGVNTAHREISKCSVYFAGTGWTESNS